MKRIGYDDSKEKLKAKDMLGLFYFSGHKAIRGSYITGLIG